MCVCVCARAYIYLVIHLFMRYLGSSISLEPVLKSFCNLHYVLYSNGLFGIHLFY